MSRFEQLRATHSASNSANEAYWQDLRNIVEKIRNDFEVYLAIPPGVAHSTRAGKASAVSIGSLDEDGVFQIVAPEALVGSNRSLYFALRLMVADSGIEPRPDIIFSLSVSKMPDGYPVVIYSGFNQPSFNGPIHTGLFDLMYKLAAEQFSTRL
ncbi:hypothetical protein [Pseudomonas viridiflava]|uniref:hypothetical protein n=1 Tax=Pseudomonas viridiflava TaxID=33069 RepID=UPI000F01C5CF|nr:hypothetical protein [Pseudomonas viridiflava]